MVTLLNEFFILWHRQNLFSFTDGTMFLFPSFNRIDIPPYESYEKLYEKLLTAVEETCGFAVEWTVAASQCPLTRLTAPSTPLLILSVTLPQGGPKDASLQARAKGCLPCLPGAQRGEVLHRASNWRTHTDTHTYIYTHMHTQPGFYAYTNTPFSGCSRIIYFPLWVKWF